MASPFWVIDPRAYRGTLPSLVKRLAEAKANTPPAQAGFFDDLYPEYIGPDGATMKALEGELEDQNVQGAVAIVNVKGILVKDCMKWEEVFFGLCCSDRVTALIHKLKADARVGAILVKGYTPGGQVHGVEQFGQAIASARDVKPVIWFVDGLTASGGLWGAVNAAHIMISGQTAEIGSCGAMFSMLDDTKFWESMGFEFYEEYATESTRKNEEVRKLLKGDNSTVVKFLDEIQAVFHGTVQQNRGSKVKKDGEVFTGAMFMGHNAIASGLADSIGDIAQAISYARALVPKQPAARGPQPVAQHQQATTTPMKFSALWASALTALGFSDAKTTATADDITKANAELKPSGLQLVTAEQAAELAGLADLKASAAKVAGLEAQVATATANDTAVKAALKDCGITAEAGKELETLIARVKAAPGAAHTDATKVAPAKEVKKYAGHDESLASASVVDPASVKAN